MNDAAITAAIERIAVRQLVGGCWRRAWRFCFDRKKRAALLAAIKARSAEKDVVLATVRMWMGAGSQRAGRTPP